MLVFVTGCYLPQHDADELGTGKQPGDYFGDAGGDDDGPSTVPDGSCANPGSSSVRVRVRTSPNGGKYAPRNIGAIWIEDGNGSFVHTLELWATTRRRYLSRWLASSLSNTADAVTGATLSDHMTHDRTWALDGAARCQHQVGSYRVVIEHTDFNGSGPTFEIPFTMGTPGTVTPADQAAFHDLLVELN